MPHGALLGYAYLQGHDLYQDSTGHSVKRAKGGIPAYLGNLPDYPVAPRPPPTIRPPTHLGPPTYLSTHHLL